MKIFKVVTGAEFVSFVIAMLYVAPSLASGLAFDDSLVWVARGLATANHAPWGALAITSQAVCAVANPLDGGRAILWAFDPPPIVARAVQLLSLGLVFALFGSVAQRIGRSFSFAVLATIVACSSLQFELPSGAAIDKIPVAPILAAATLGLSLSLMRARLRWRSTLVGAICVAFVGLCGPIALSLAIASALVAAALTLAGSRRITVLAFAAGDIAAITVASLGRARAHCTDMSFEPYTGGPSSALHALLPTIPGAYRALGNIVRDGRPYFDIDTRIDAYPALGLAGIALLIIGALLAYWSLRRIDARSAVDLRSVWIPAILWLGPAALALFSSAWDSTVSLVQIFALSIGIASVARVTFPRFRSYRPEAAAIATLALVLVLYGNVRANDAVVTSSRASFEIARELRSAAQLGAFDKVDSVRVGIVPPLRTDLMTRLVHVMTALRNVQGTRDRRFVKLAEPATCDGRRVCPPYVLERVASGPLSASIVLAAAEGVAHGEIVTRSADIYQTFQSPEELAVGTQFFKAPRSDGVVATIVAASDLAVALRVSRKCSAVSAARLLDADLARVDFSSGFYEPNYSIRVLFPGASDLEANPFSGWRFGANGATLEETSGCVPDDGARYVVSGIVSTPAPATVDITSSDGAKTTVRTDPAGAAFLIVVSSGAHTVKLSTSNGPIAAESFATPRFENDRKLKVALLVRDLLIRRRTY